MTVYMFHYVTKNLNYFHFDAELFDARVKELKNTYEIIGLDEVFKSKSDVKDNKVILTFDDGTKDHYQFVYPVLKKYDVKGIFFLSSNIFENKVLDIHLIHQLIMKVGIEKLYEDVQNLIIQNRVLIDNDKFINTTKDNDKMKYVKQTLQFILPDNIRNYVLSELVCKYNISQNMEDYYLTKNEIIEMKNSGMEFGLHTANHKRLEFLNKEEQKDEILSNLNLLKSNDFLPGFKAIAYPFGSYNENTIEILKELKINLGFTIDKTLGINHLFEIKRIDCNTLK